MGLYATGRHSTPHYATSCHTMPQTTAQPCHVARYAKPTPAMTQHGNTLYDIACCSVPRYATPSHGTARHGPAMPLHYMPGQDLPRHDMTSNSTAPHATSQCSAPHYVTSSHIIAQWSNHATSWYAKSCQDTVPNSTALHAVVHHTYHTKPYHSTSQPNHTIAWYDMPRPAKTQYGSPRSMLSHETSMPLYGAQPY